MHRGTGSRIPETLMESGKLLICRRSSSLELTKIPTQANMVEAQRKL
ncbi:MAG: hypothetical protein J5878_00540 [Oscillospiraceae bacterium]|nr:hypothetical protein [Oscillospiraceae bacterium]